MGPFILIYAQSMPRARSFPYQYDAKNEVNALDGRVLWPEMQMSTGSLITRAYGDHTSDESTDR